MCASGAFFFFFSQWPCWEFLWLLHSFELAYTDKTHSSKITADHSASGNDDEVTVIWAQFHGHKPSSLAGKAQPFCVCFKCLGRKAAITERGFRSL